MRLKQYIKELTELLEEVGDVECYTAADDECNSYNSTYGPGIYYLSPDDDSYRPESLIPEREEGEEFRYWLDEHCLEEDEVKYLQKVVVL